VIVRRGIRKGLKLGKSQVANPRNQFQVLTYREKPPALVYLQAHASPNPILLELKVQTRGTQLERERRRDLVRRIEVPVPDHHLLLSTLLLLQDSKVSKIKIALSISSFFLTTPLISMFGMFQNQKIKSLKCLYSTTKVCPSTKERMLIHNYIFIAFDFEGVAVSDPDKEEKSQRSKPVKIHVGKLTRNVTKKHLFELFGKFGTVKVVFISRYDKYFFLP